jgi:hypothetical protein
VAFFVAAAGERLHGKPLRTSPLASALGKIAIGDTHGIPTARRTVLLLSDAREVSAFDFECAKKLPSVSVWGNWTALRVPAGSWRGASIIFSYATASATGRTGACPAASIERTLQIRELWQRTLSEQAGAARVLFLSGLPEPASLLNSSTVAAR